MKKIIKRIVQKIWKEVKVIRRSNRGTRPFLCLFFKRSSLLLNVVWVLKRPRKIRRGATTTEAVRCRLKEPKVRLVTLDRDFDRVLVITLRVAVEMHRATQGLPGTCTSWYIESFLVRGFIILREFITTP